MTRRLLSAEERHAAHHEQIAERVAAFQGAPRRSGLDKRLRRERFKTATWTVAGHLRSCHGWRRMVGAPLSLDELLAIHDRFHEEES
jgi:hypothetical protein